MRPGREDRLTAGGQVRVPACVRSTHCQSTAAASSSRAATGSRRAAAQCQRSRGGRGRRTSSVWRDGAQCPQQLGVCYSGPRPRVHRWSACHRGLRVDRRRGTASGTPGRYHEEARATSGLQEEDGRPPAQGFFGVALSARDREFGDTVFVGSFCVREHGERLPSVCLGQPEVESEGPAVRGRPLARPAPP